MSVLDPDGPIEDVVVEEPVVVPVASRPVNEACRDTCANCRRPLIELDNRGWVHLDARIDMPTNPGFCIAELFEEPVVRWGFQEVKGKGNFNVSPGRKVGSGGGAAA